MLCSLAIPEALATVAYGYEQLGDKATAQQYIDVLKLNYPNLVKSDGSVNLRAARKEGSWLNRATLGVFGREEQSTVETPKTTAPAEQRSLTNRMTFGLLDRPATSTEAPASSTSAE